MNLKTGERKRYSTSGLDIDGICYENGYLYILAASDFDYTLHNIYCMDVVSGEKEYLADYISSVWLENGYLYFVWCDWSREDWPYNLGVLNLGTKQLSTEETLWKKGSSYLQVVGDDLLVSMATYENWIHLKEEKDIYFRYRAGTLQLDRLDRKEKLEENTQNLDSRKQRAKWEYLHAHFATAVGQAT